MADRTRSPGRPEATPAGDEPDSDAMPTGRGVGRAGTPAQGRELRARGRATMRRLLDAGIDVFAKRGFHAARVDDIVKAAKTSHGTFYLYFSSKEDLFTALVADVGEEMVRLSGSLGELTPDDAGRDALRAWLTTFSEVYAHYGPVIRTWTEAEAGSNEAGRVGADVLGDLAAGISVRVAEHAPPGVDPAVAALAYVAMIERVNYFVVSGQVDGGGDAMNDTLAAVIHTSLFGRP